jgi:hypothetical protein
MQASQEFMACLRRLKLPLHQVKWRSIRVAVETVWNKDKITAMSLRLSTLRSELVKRVLIVLNTKADLQAAEQGQRFDRLEEHDNDIIEVISINQQWLIQVMSKQQIDQRYHQAESTRLAEKHHAETISAILTLRDGSTRFIGNDSFKATTQPTDGGKTGGQQTIKTLRAGSARLPVDQRWLAQIIDFNTLYYRVLDCLYFRQITDRIELISPKHTMTFEWIFQDTSQHQKPWSNFTQWLTTDSGCYWINGKAGAGKSTLLKFIQNDPRYLRHLEQWAQGHLLVTASFFLWNIGTDLQKSQLGLLRTILHDVLVQCPSLTPIVFPDMCRALARDFNRSNMFEPSPAELWKAFRTMVAQQSVQLRICLLIDGIDEYEGDHAELQHF